MVSQTKDSAIASVFFYELMIILKSLGQANRADFKVTNN